MSKYKTVIEVPAEEFELLDRMFTQVAPMSYEDLKAVVDGCKVSWDMGCCMEESGYCDRLLYAMFDNGMIMDLWFTREVGVESGGYFTGIRFGDRDELYIEEGEFTDTCYVTSEPPTDTIASTYSVFCNGDTYEAEVRRAA